MAIKETNEMSRAPSPFEALNAQWTKEGYLVVNASLKSHEIFKSIEPILGSLKKQGIRVSTEPVCLPRKFRMTIPPHGMKISLSLFETKFPCFVRTILETLPIKNRL